MSDEVIEVIETPLFTCGCGCTYFEKKQICEFQHNSKYAADKFVPITIIDVLKCMYCGLHYNNDGNTVDITAMMMIPK